MIHTQIKEKKNIIVTSYTSTLLLCLSWNNSHFAAQLF